jgi:hypothetical protein
MYTLKMLEFANNGQEMTQLYKDQSKNHEQLKLFFLQKNEWLHAREDELRGEIAELKKGQIATESTRITPTETITKESRTHLEGRQNPYAVDPSDRLTLASSNDQSDIMGSTISTNVSEDQSQMPAANPFTRHRRMETYDYSSSDDGDSYELQFGQFTNTGYHQPRGISPQPTQPPPVNYIYSPEVSLCDATQRSEVSNFALTLAKEKQARQRAESMAESERLRAELVQTFNPDKDQSEQSRVMVPRQQSDPVHVIRQSSAISPDVERGLIKDPLDSQKIVKGWRDAFRQGWNNDSAEHLRERELADAKARLRVKREPRNKVAEEELRRMAEWDDQNTNL